MCLIGSHCTFTSENIIMKRVIFKKKEKKEWYLCAMLQPRHPPYRSFKVQLHLYLECHCNRVTLFQLIRFLPGTFFLRQLCRFLRSRSRVKFWTASICQDELPFKFCQQLLDFCQLISFCSRHLFWLLKKNFRLLQKRPVTDELCQITLGSYG